VADAVRDRRLPASEILALNVEDLDLEQRRAPIRSKGADTEFIYWDTGTAHLLPRLLRPTARRAPAGRCSWPAAGRPGTPPCAPRHLPAHRPGTPRL
jgi:hypothetical protein